MSGLGISVVAAAVLSGGIASHAADSVVPDAALATCVNTALEHPAGAPITEADLAGLTQRIDCSSKKVKSVEGLQYASKVVRADLSYNDIVDLTPLAGMTSLKTLALRYNGDITSVEPLGNLTSLERLDLNNAPNLVDISPVGKLSKLRELTFNNTGVSDITALSNNTALVELIFSGSKVKDLAPLANLTSLKDLRFGGNEVTDVTPLASIVKNLDTMRADNNRISDLSSLGARPRSVITTAANQLGLTSSDVWYVPVGADTYTTELTWSPKSWNGTPVNAETYDAASGTWNDTKTPFAGGGAKTFTLANDGSAPTQYFTAGNPDDGFDGAVDFTVVRSDFVDGTPSVLSAVVGQPYSYAFNVSKGFQVAKWEASGALPAGLSLNADGTISGTPTVEGEFTFEVSALDKWGNAIHRSLSLNVAPKGDTGGSSDHGAENNPSPTASASTATAAPTATAATGAEQVAMTGTNLESAMLLGGGSLLALVIGALTLLVARVKYSRAS